MTLYVKGEKHEYVDRMMKDEIAQIQGNRKWNQTECLPEARILWNA